MSAIDRETIEGVIVRWRLVEFTRRSGERRKLCANFRLGSATYYWEDLMPEDAAIEAVKEIGRAAIARMIARRRAA